MCDVTIHGAGIFGLSIAFTCLRRGATVRVIDPAGPGAGASGGIVGALAPHVPENWNAKKAFQFESLLMAEQFWKNVEAVSGHASGYARTGRLQPIEDEQAQRLAEQRATSARTLWRGVATWRVVRAEDTAFAPRSATGLLVHDTLSARLHPARACFALAAAVTALGGQIAGEGVETGAIVHATGVAGLEDMSRAFAQPVGCGIKGQAALLDFAAPAAPQLFADALHIVPHANGTTAIGSTSESDYQNAGETDMQLDDLIAKARCAVSDLAGAPVLARWAGLRPRARSRAPMLGPWPDRPGHFVANGGFKIGFGMAPKCADVMADLILDGQDNIPSGFRVEASLPAVVR